MILDISCQDGQVANKKTSNSPVSSPYTFSDPIALLNPKVDLDILPKAGRIGSAMKILCKNIPGI